MAGILFIISAPSGSGKSTLVSEVRRLVEGLEFSISYTTRSARGSEEDGVEYHFITPEKFETMIAADEFLEWAQVFHKHYYGTARKALEHARENQKDLILDIDVQGALQVMDRLPEAVSIFILPPSHEVLEMRLRSRSQAEGKTDEAEIDTRLNNARLELEKIGDYKFAIVNDVLEHAVQELRAIVLETRGEHEGNAEVAESCLTHNLSPRLKAALASFGVHPEQI